MALNRIPQNTGGEPYLGVSSIRVAAWGPGRDGRGPNTELHVEMTARGCPYPIVLAVTPAEADVFIANLRTIRSEAWPHIPPGA
jgi:hypothetical protein